MRKWWWVQTKSSYLFSFPIHPLLQLGLFIHNSLFLSLRKCTQENSFVTPRKLHKSSAQERHVSEQLPGLQRRSQNTSVQHLHSQGQNNQHTCRRLPTERSAQVCLLPHTRKTSCHLKEFTAPSPAELGHRSRITSTSWLFAQSLLNGREIAQVAAESKHGFTVSPEKSREIQAAVPNN